MYRSVKTIHPDVFCSNETVKNIVGIIGAQTSQVNIYIILAGVPGVMVIFIIVNPAVYPRLSLNYDLFIITRQYSMRYEQ